MEPDKQSTAGPIINDPDSSEVPQAEPTPVVPAVASPIKPKMDKRTIWIIVLAAMIVLAAGVFWFLMKDDESADSTTTDQTDSSSDTSTSQTDADTTDTIGAVPDLTNIVYSFGDSYDGPGAVYHRPVSGGDRIQLVSLTELNSVSANHHQLISRGYAYIKDYTQIWYGDGVSEPSKVYEADGATTLSGVAISVDGSKIAFAIVPDMGSSGTAVEVVYIDNTGSGQTTILDDTYDGLFWMQPQKWVDNDGKIVLTAGAYGTDAPQPMPWIVDVASGDISKLMEDKTGDNIASYSVSPSGNKMVYVENTVDETIALDTLRGYYIGAPFTVKVLDVASDSSTEIETFGTLNASDPQYYNGDTGWKFSTSGPVPLYVKDNTVLAKSASSITTAFESGNPVIGKILFASDSKILVASATSQASYWAGELTYTYYDYGTETSTVLMNATAETYNIGLIVQ